MGIFLPVLGGLALFLYGMTLMGAGLQNFAGSRLKRLIEVLTNNRFMGLLIGTVVTMIVQSSSAISVMVIGFVNAGLMTLSQAVGVLMGANIGTTITGQIIAFDLGAIAPVVVAVGVFMMLFSNKRQWKNISEILIGFGILFIGMGMMSSGLKPLANLPAFSNVMIQLENPLLSMLAGIIGTTMIQSSSAFTGLILALSMQGLISLEVALPMIYGSNIGTTTTAAISSIGASRNAKRTAVIHFLFNAIGTIVFMAILGQPLKLFVEFLTPGNVTRQIANAHTLFNLVTVLTLFPFADVLVKIAKKLIPGEEMEPQHAKYLDPRILSTPVIALGQAKKEVLHLGELALTNLKDAKALIVENKTQLLDRIYQTEKVINLVEREITDYLIAVNNEDLSNADRRVINDLINIVNDIERVGDHVENLAETASYKLDNGCVFSELANEELNEMFELCIHTFEEALEVYENRDLVKAKDVLVLEEKIDNLEKTLRCNHIERLNQGKCHSMPGVLFLDCISNLERIGDHSTNVVSYILDDKEIESASVLTIQ